MKHKCKDCQQIDDQCVCEELTAWFDDCFEYLYLSGPELEIMEKEQ